MAPASARGRCCLQQGDHASGTTPCLRSTSSGSPRPRQARTSVGFPDNGCHSRVNDELKVCACRLYWNTKEVATSEALNNGMAATTASGAMITTTAQDEPDAGPEGPPRERPRHRRLQYLEAQTAGLLKLHPVPTALACCRQGPRRRYRHRRTLVTRVRHPSPERYLRARETREQVLQYAQCWRGITAYAPFSHPSHAPIVVHSRIQTPPPARDARVAGDGAQSARNGRQPEGSRSGKWRGTNGEGNEEQFIRSWGWVGRFCGHTGGTYDIGRYREGDKEEGAALSVSNCDGLRFPVRSQLHGRGKRPYELRKLNASFKLRPRTRLMWRRWLWMSTEAFQLRMFSSASASAIDSFTAIPLTLDGNVDMNKEGTSARENGRPRYRCPYLRLEDFAGREDCLVGAGGAGTGDVMKEQRQKKISAHGVKGRA
ncbi:hypothetical protein FPV67DRAFT_1450184 [Lyophyllum atratum]|nr:hypothetical protein FPV67DRAFT_1450184 [Lyophyllum atratum]